MGVSKDRDRKALATTEKYLGSDPEIAVAVNG
jgi:hypothetical protein